MPNKKTHRKTQRQTRNQDQMNRLPEPPRFVGVYSEPKNIAPEKDKSKKKRKKTQSNSKPVIHVEPVQPVVPKIARPNPLEVKARAAARAAERAATAAAVQVPKRKPPPLKPRGARVRVEPPPEPPPMTVKRMMPKPKPRTRQTRKTYNRPVNMAEFMMAANKQMKRSIPKMSRKSPAFFNIPNGTNELKDAVTEVANSFRVVPRGSMNPLLIEPVNHPLTRGSFMSRKLSEQVKGPKPLSMSEQVKGMKLNVIKE